MRKGGSTDEAVFSELLAESENTVQTMSLARALYEAVRKDQDQEGVLNAHSIYYILGGEHLIPAIEATIAMMQSDLIGALATSDNGSLYTRPGQRTDGGRTAGKRRRARIRSISRSSFNHGGKTHGRHDPLPRRVK